ncbi:hypothetical protein ACFOET_20175 [Parapedobacter deserti]|uniref:DUF11 domain-containing protein n=1 Tax=Parapedobacter deserti TaxID=1912957 RepID=A0ABV7JSR1_9SPHI
MKGLKKLVMHRRLMDLNTVFRMTSLVVASIVYCCHTSKAQFTIIDDLRGNNYPDIVVGGPGGTQGEAYFTSGIDDPVGSGWLRLTRDRINQRGFAYIDRSFPSGMGVLIDFEYKMWRSHSDGSYSGADGLSVFLFDATTDFRLGGYGGSLGYAPNNAGGVPQGLAGGYIGVGLDAYGNFSNPTEGRSGGPGRRPNSIVLRGPTTDNLSSTNRYLTGNQLSGNVRDDELDYNTTTAQRPSSDVFYRRVQITIMYNTGAGLYDITVRWTKAPGAAFTELLTYQTTVPPPPTMKVGFAASTGSGFNYHEIRNILVTTLGNLRTVKLADKDFLIPTNAGGGDANENEITYTIEVVNDTDARITGIVVRDTIKDAYGNVLSPETFTIDPESIIVLNPDVLEVASEIQETETNIIQGTVSIAAGETGRIQVTGTLHQTPPGNHIINTVMLDLPEGTDYDDEDPLNNISSVRTPVYADGVDLILGDLIADGRCIDYAKGNVFMVQVSNLGTDDVNVNINKITVTVNHPAGITLTPINHSRWTIVSNDDTTYEFRLDNPSVETLRRGFTHPDAIRFRLTPQPTSTPKLSSYTVSASVTHADEDGGNHGNNTSTASPYNCTVTSNPMIYQRVKW